MNLFQSWTIFGCFIFNIMHLNDVSKTVIESSSVVTIYIASFRSEGLQLQESN